MLQLAESRLPLLDNPVLSNKDAMQGGHSDMNCLSGAYRAKTHIRLVMCRQAFASHPLMGCVFHGGLP